MGIAGLEQDGEHLEAILHSSEITSSHRKDEVTIQNAVLNKQNAIFVWHIPLLERQLPQFINKARR